MVLPSVSGPGVVRAEVFELVVEEGPPFFVEVVPDLDTWSPGKLFRGGVSQFCHGVGPVFCSDACVRVVVPGVEFALESVLN